MLTRLGANAKFHDPNFLFHQVKIMSFQFYSLLVCAYQAAEEIYFVLDDKS